MQDDADRLNKVFNSFENSMDDFISMRDDIENFNDSSTIEDLRKNLRGKMSKMQKSQARFIYNTLWFMTKDQFNGEHDDELVKLLSEGEAIHYNKCVKHLKYRIKSFMKR